MTLTRRRVIGLGGGIAAGLLFLPAASRAAQTVEIRMRGDATGSHVQFDPVGLRLRPGTTVRWTNGDAGNSHTATAYHPAYFDRPRRIPAAAQPWDSDYLLPDESFAVTFAVEGVYRLLLRAARARRHGRPRSSSASPMPTAGGRIRQRPGICRRSP